ncbi:MAG: ABC transporter ATP-binding protein [Chloroflexota bacterium]|nr:ABC transporter ATP-binding protein [Chloroflexota bacterium]
MSLLRLSSVTKTFGSGLGEVRPLDCIDLEILPREVAAVMGPSGSGKTTLLTIAGALQRPTSGVVEVGGAEIQNFSQTELGSVRRRQIGFVFQSFNLLEALTAAENVEYALQLSGHNGRHSRERARQLLSLVEMTNRSHELPKRLSGGERQRIAIARALANDGKLILADEPTASLDHKRAMDLLAMLRGITRDLERSVLLVTHDVRAQDAADRIFWLEDGHLQQIEHGSAHQRPN